MKKLFAFFFSAFLVLGTIHSQSSSNNDVTFEDFQRYFKSKLKMDYRKATINNLELTSDEIVAFDPIFLDYMEDKSRLFDKKMRLMDRFKEEMAEDDSEKNQNEDRADFIEDYWEIEIAESELRKDYYDLLEGKISKDKAASFFLWEEAIDNRITTNSVGEFIPRFIEVGNIPSTDKFMNVNTTGATSEKTDDITTEQYEEYIDNKLEVEFRNVTLKALDFTEDEIIAFDPIYLSYMKDKDAIFDRKMSLIKSYKEEMKEDDSASNQAEDRADFIEEYWEAHIASMDLSKEYFDRLEDAIPVKKAAKFFIWERAVENRIAADVWYSMMPNLVIVEKIEPKVTTIVIEETESEEETMTTTKKEKPTISADTEKMIASFDSWVKNNRGQVSLSHEYTSNGLKTLVKTIESVKNDLEVRIPNFDYKKQMIMDNAHEITVNWKETDHADHTKDSFQAVAELMSSINGTNNLKSIANQMNDDVLMTKQAETIYRFFDAANSELRKLTMSTAMKNSSNDSDTASNRR